MDTKLKSSNKKIITSLIVFSLIIATILGLLSNSYPKINYKVNSKNISLLENYSFEDKLSKSSFVLYKELLEKKENRSILSSDLFYNSYDYQYDNRHSEGYCKEKISETFAKWERNLKVKLSNLEYYIKDNNSDVFYTNTDEKLNLLIGDTNVDQTEVDNLKNYYKYYMIISYNENGAANIVDVKNANKEKARDIYTSTLNRLSMYDEVNFLANGPKNITIVYGIPNNLKFVDDITWYEERLVEDVYEDSVVVYLLISYMVIVLLSLLIPFKYEKEVIGVRKIFKIPFEFIFVILSCIISITIAAAPNLIYETMNSNGEIKRVLIENGFSKPFINYLFDIGNIIYWFIAFSSVFIAIVLIKQIFSKGIIKYLKENTLLGKILKSLKMACTNIYSEIVSIDLSESSNKILIKILTINFIVLSVMCITWFFGLGISIAYTLFLFIVLRKYFEDIKKKYRILLEATNKIAEGNLDVTIDENIGVFEPIKDELKKIQSGFKNAVDEEVKSQKMKTELISNVSHDLKTPLTSIITYVDLLKDENITEEERKSYIDTLDRKSQRLKQLIDDLFEVSKATSKSVQLNIIDVDVVSLMKQTQVELSDKIEESSLKFKWNLPNHKVIVPLDSQKTFRIFENLLMNIVKYAMPNSRVYIDIIDEEKSVLVTLKNMSANELDFNPEEIVERFVRGDKSRNTEGVGLGLSIVKSFVEIQGGTLNIEIDGDLFKVLIRFNK